MTVVNAEELKAYMSGIRMTSSQSTTAQLILDGVQAELEIHLNRAIEPRLIKETVYTSPDGTAYLNFSPVSKVHKISLVSVGSMPGMLPTGPWAPGEEVEFDGPTYDYVPSDFGVDLIVPGGIALDNPAAYYVIEYESGGGDFIRPFLPAIKLAILRVASREFQRMSNTTVEINNGEPRPQVDYVRPSKRGWQPDELVQFDRLRRRVVV